MAIYGQKTIQQTRQNNCKAKPLENQNESVSLDVKRQALESDFVFMFYA